MAKVKYTGEVRRTFTWTSMGVSKSYSVSPGHTLNVPEADMPYLLSFGAFTALVEVTDEQAAKQETEATFERKKVNPLVSEIRVYATEESTPVEEKKSPEPIAEKQPEPVVEAVPVVVPEVEEPEEEEVEESEEEEEEEERIDYTSFSKKELVKICKERGLATIGKRDDLIARCVNYDNEK